MAFETSPPKKVSLSELITQRNNERGLEPLALEPELLIERIKKGGKSGRYLAVAFLSTYRNQPFEESLFDLVNLDAEGFRLFHQIIHMRHAPAWNDDRMYEIEQRIIAILRGELL